MGKFQGWAFTSQQPNRESHRILFGIAQCFPPLLKFIGEFNFPHIYIIFHRRNNVKRLLKVFLFFRLSGNGALSAFRAVPAQSGGAAFSGEGGDKGVTR
jgi:hypothetical protein